MNRIERISDYRIKLHTSIYDRFTANDIMDNIIANFTHSNIGIMCNNVEDNIIGFSVSTIDVDLIKEYVYRAYHKFFYQLVNTNDKDWELSNDISLDNLYNLTILNNQDRSNVLLVL